MTAIQRHRALVQTGSEVGVYKRAIAVVTRELVEENVEESVIMLYRISLLYRLSRDLFCSHGRKL